MSPDLKTSVYFFSPHPLFVLRIISWVEGSPRVLWSQTCNNFSEFQWSFYINGQNPSLCSTDSLSIFIPNWNQIIFLQVGTCYAPKECRDKNGTAAGECAQGYGVCCVCKLFLIYKTNLLWIPQNKKKIKCCKMFFWCL